jgi:hypothetical protein
MATLLGYSTPSGTAFLACLGADAFPIVKREAELASTGGNLELHHEALAPATLLSSGTQNPFGR